VVPQLFIERPDLYIYASFSHDEKLAEYDCGSGIEWVLSKYDEVLPASNNPPKIYFPVPAELRYFNELSLQWNGKQIETINDSYLQSHFSPHISPLGGPVVTAEIFVPKSALEKVLEDSYAYKSEIDIPTSAGFDVQQTQTAAKCLYAHKKELDQIFRVNNEATFLYVMLYDDSIKGLESIPLDTPTDQYKTTADASTVGYAQVFRCANDSELVTSNNFIYVLRHPLSIWTHDWYFKPLGFMTLTKGIVTNHEHPDSGPRYWNSEQSVTLTSDQGSCVNSKGLTFEKYLSDLPSKLHFYQ
jgi:hypothetical protein